MKKILKYIPVLLVLLYACDPMEDVYNDLDKAREPYNEAVEFMMTADDYKTVSKQALKDATNAEDTAYAKAVESDMSFNQKYTDLDYMKYVLHTNYIALNKKSVAKVEYNTMDKPEELIALEAAEMYYVSEEDYNSVSEDVGKAQAFFPGYEAEEYIAGILDAAIENPEDGQIVNVNYNYFVEVPEIGMATLFEEGFNETLGDFELINVTGEQVWQASSYGGDNYAKMSGYDNGAFANEDWLISPEVDLSNEIDVNLQFRQAINFLNDEWDQIKVLISSDYTGDVAAATWDEIVVENKPAGNSWSFVESEEIDLEMYEGEKVYLAFKYLSSSSNAPTWEIDWLKFQALGVSGDLDKRAALYVFNGEWKPVNDTYIVSSKDYDMFGTPGKYDNFSTSDAPENYLPTYLQSKFPYAQEGDMQYVGYKYYYNRNTSFKVSKYVFTEGMWTSESSGPFITVTNQFVHNGTTWVFDPTVAFTMGKSDYQLVVDYVRDNISEDYAPYSDGEYYYGASGRYTNFDLRIKNRTKYDIPTGIEGKTFEDLSEEEALEVIWDRLPEGIIEMLKAKYPEATTQVGGVDVYYEVEFKTYENDLSSNFYTYKFKCTKSGPNPEFDFIEDITPEN
ncbi:MAG: DUF5017 domain-containing protein [Bacteroidales bacterium]|nr:DUF5017 domain-containing protein [Bacteroidales bacterium]